MNNSKKLIMFLLLFVILILVACVQKKYFDFDLLDKWKSQRPRISLTNDQVLEYYLENKDDLDPIEGIWVYSFYFDMSLEGTINPDNNVGMQSTDKNVWKVAIIKDFSQPYSEKYTESLFEPLGVNSGYKKLDIGIILGYFQAGLYPNNFIHEYPMGPKEAFPNIKPTKEIMIRDNFIYKIQKFTLENNMLHSKQETKPSSSGLHLDFNSEQLYIKEPFLFEEKLQPKESSSDVKYSGSGSIISETGLVVTNYHVIEEKSEINVFLPQLNKEYIADIVLKDKNNDLVILKLQNFIFSEIFSNSIPFVISTSSKTKLGEDVFTLGFPLGDILGKSSKFSSGKINSLFGIQDDPRVYQISNPIQSGNSGGPLFNSNGEFIGIVFSSLNAKYFYENADIIPQNVNFAIKSDYLLNLISLLPDENEISNRNNSLSELPVEKQIELLQPFIVNVKAK